MLDEVDLFIVDNITLPVFFKTRFQWLYNSVDVKLRGFADPQDSRILMISKVLVS